MADTSDVLLKMIEEGWSLVHFHRIDIDFSGQHVRRVAPH